MQSLVAPASILPSLMPSYVPSPRISFPVLKHSPGGRRLGIPSDCSSESQILFGHQILRCLSTPRGRLLPAACFLRLSGVSCSCRPIPLLRISVAFRGDLLLTQSKRTAPPRCLARSLGRCILHLRIFQLIVFLSAALNGCLKLSRRCDLWSLLILLGLSLLG